LRYAPIAALYDGDKFLIERQALIVRTPAVQQPARAQPRSWSVAALGSTRGDDQLAKLPAVARELERIVRRDASDPDGVLPGRIFLDEAFTAASLRAVSGAATPVVHVASHFVLQPGRAQESFLLLGNGARLSLADFAAQGVSFDGVDLLTLSACDTAAPAGGDGREVEGFGALAQQRGAARVLATLWPVADESTADFMWRVYEFHRRGSTTAEALRRAQLSFLRGRANSSRAHPAPYRHPFYWAPFVLMGDWR
jgi:CHAT domain-containing protein